MSKRDIEAEIKHLKELLEEAAELMDNGQRLQGENLWFSVCKDMLNVLEELNKKLDDHLAWHVGEEWRKEIEGASP